MVSIVLAGAVSIPGIQTYHQGWTGLSMQSLEANKMEDRYFQVLNLKKQKEVLLYENKTKAKISSVISSFNTGLKENEESKIPDWIYAQSLKYGYDPLFLTAVIITESSFNNWARSRRGALGLMQIKPRTGLALASETRIPWAGKPTLYDPKSNISLGAYYLNKLVLRFGDLGLALEAYNHGPTQVSKFLRKGYRPKTYSQKVFKFYKQIRSREI